MESIIIFLPLFGALIAAIFGKKFGEFFAQVFTSLGVGLTAIFSIPIFIDVALNGNERTIIILEWIVSGSFNSYWAVRFDTLSSVMISTVSCVSFLIHIYSIGYMSHDKSKIRFMCYLSLFTFAMLMLVTSNNLIQLFFGWEGVGVFSYLLIGFWYHKDSANSAAIKAFLVNRVGDFSFLLGIFALYLVFDSVNFDSIFSSVYDFSDLKVSFLSFNINALTLISLLLFFGAMGKSAQIFLHTWLPDAMEGPTPVSALIHAATMVTAGVFLVVRMSPVYEFSQFTLSLITIVGASTAFFAATIACVQNDIKRVIAYSTCSQLGYMFFACGIGAYSAAIFHLMTHAWFKALLFLGAGSVIHSMSDEQDMRKMGGLWNKIKFTYLIMWIGSFALVAVPPFAGYFSKDIILESAFAADSSVGNYAFLMGISAAIMTAFYSGRLLLLTFHGKPRSESDVFDKVHESPLVMTIPLALLALGAIFSGMVGYDYFVGDKYDLFWRDSIIILGRNILEDIHHVPSWVIFLPLISTIIGLLISIYLYKVRTSLPKELSIKFKNVYYFLFNKWYFDELYDFLFVKSSFSLGKYFWRKCDEETIDRFGPDGISFLILFNSKRLSLLQSGYLYHYAFIMIIGLAAIVSWFVVGR